jgi:hypothetical protein
VIHHKCVALSREWLMLRCGLPTSSEFHKILTPGGKLSDQSRLYMHCLLAELMLGRPLENPATQWMIRGQDTESEAISAYEFQADIETEAGGFFTDDLATYGASPDRLVQSDGIVEMKVPAPQTHVGYLIGQPVTKDHSVQVQGQMLVTGRAWVDLVSYHPEMPLVVVRVERDEKCIALLSDALAAFVDVLTQKRVELEQRFGPFPSLEPKPEERSDLLITNEDLESMIAEIDSRDGWTAGAK